MSARISYIDARNDAGLLREYLAREYGNVFRFGGSTSSWRMARAIRNRLARMTKRTPAAVQAQAIEDINQMEDQ